MRCSVAIPVAIAIFPLLFAATCRCDFGSYGADDDDDNSGGSSSGSAVTAAAVRSGNGTGRANRWKQHNGGGGGGGLHHRQSHMHRHAKTALNVGMLVPKTSFGVRGYLRAINDAMHGMNRAYKKNHTMNYSKLYDFEASNVRYRMMSLTPSPTGRYDARVLLSITLSHSSDKKTFLFYVFSSPTHNTPCTINARFHSNTFKSD